MLERVFFTARAACFKITVAESGPLQLRVEPGDSKRGRGFALGGGAWSEFGGRAGQAARVFSGTDVSVRALPLITLPLLS